MQAGASCVTLSELSNEELPSIKRRRALFRRSLAQWRPCSPEESCFKNTACSRLRRGFCRKQLLCELTWTKCPVFMSPISRGRPINDLLIFTMEMRIWKPRGASEELFYSWWSFFFFFFEEICFPSQDTFILGNSFHFKQRKTIFSSGHFLYMLKKKKPKEKKRNPQLIMSFFKLWVRSGKKKKSNFPKWSITETNSLKNTWIKKEKNKLFFSWNFLIKLRLSRQSFLPPVPKS